MTEQIVNNITVKQIELGEADLMVSLFNQYRIFYKQFSDIGMAKAFIEERLANRESIIFVAMSAAQPVGFTQLYPKYSSAKLTKNWILNDLFVAVDFRKQGVAKKLIDAAMEFAKKQGSTFLQLETGVDNYAAQSLYEAIGFEKQGNDEDFLLYKIAINS